VTSPSSDNTFTAPANITVEATGSATAGLARIDVYAGSTLIGSGTTSTITAAWLNVAAGTYALTAVATDATGATGRSAPVSVSVVNPGTAPQPSATPFGSVTWPSSDSSFTAPANITVQASGASTAGLARIDVYAGSTLIGSGTTSPIAVAWSNVA